MLCFYRKISGRGLRQVRFKSTKSLRNASVSAHKKTPAGCSLPEFFSLSTPWGVCGFLVGCRELFEKPYVVLGEKSEVVNLVFEVGDSLYAHSEGITRILF